jgi:hypothetical protein
MGILAWKILIDEAIRPLIINCPQSQWPTFLPALIPPLLRWLVEHTEWEALNQMASVKANGEDGIQDEDAEVSKEAVLRFLFEGMVGLCTDLISPMTRGDTAIVVNSKEMAFASRETDSRTAALRKKIELRAFVLERQVFTSIVDYSSLQDLMEAYLLLTSRLLKVHDTRAVTHTVRNVTSILRILTTQPHYQQFVANTILEAALRSYNDSYFAETQSELLDLIQQIYTMDTSGEARALLLKLPGVQESSLTTYDQKLQEHQSARSKRQFTKDLLAEIKGLATSEQGRKKVDLGPDTSARSMMQKLAMEAAAKAKRDRGDLLGQADEKSMHAEEGAVLHLLFGNGG